MFSWFRRSSLDRDTAVAMVDPRAGNELLVIGAENPRLAALSAAITGLTGRTVATGRGADEKRRVEDAAGNAGALVEFVDAPSAMLPFDTGTFDVVVIPALGDSPGHQAAPILAEAVRVAKPAGRIIAIAGERRAGLFGALQRREPTLAADTILSLFKSAGAIAVRRLAEVDGRGYYEGRKPR